MSDKGFRKDNRLRKKGQKLAEPVCPRLFPLFMEKKIKESIEKWIKNIAGRELASRIKYFTIIDSSSQVVHSEKTGQHLSQRRNN